MAVFRIKTKQMLEIIDNSITTGENLEMEKKYYQ